MYSLNFNLKKKYKIIILKFMRNKSLSKLTSSLKQFVEKPFKERSSISIKNLKILRSILKK